VDHIDDFYSRCSVWKCTALFRTAFAQYPGWYLGAGIGSSRYSDAQTSTYTGGPTEDSHLTGTAYRFKIGYELNRWVALEAAYTDFGQADTVATWPVGSVGPCVIGYFSPCNGNVAQTTTSAAYTVSVKGTAPITANLDLFGTIGPSQVKTRTKYTNGTTTTEVKDTHTTSTYGLGARYRFNRNVAMTLDWQANKRIGSDNDKRTVDIYFLGLEYFY
jgi:hypothetical protein